MKESVLKIIKTPLVYIFSGIYFLAVLIKRNFKEYALTDALFTFLLFSCLLTTIMFLISKSSNRNVITIKDPEKESLIVITYFLGWLLIFMAFGKHLLTNKFLSVGLGFRGLLVILPFIYLKLNGYRIADFGLTKRFYIQNLKVSILACLAVIGLLLFITPGGKYILNRALPFDTLIISFSISFGYALISAAFFEEFFFRGILQTRLTQYFKSDIKGILVASIVFGLYHLPFQYYNEAASNGDIIYALSNVFTEQMITAPVFGILWARTQNLVAP